MTQALIPRELQKNYCCVLLLKELIKCSYTVLNKCIGQYIADYCNSIEGFFNYESNSI